MDSKRDYSLPSIKKPQIDKQIHLRSFLNPSEKSICPCVAPPLLERLKNISRKKMLSCSRLPKDSMLRILVYNKEVKNEPQRKNCFVYKISKSQPCAVQSNHPEIKKLIMTCQQYFESTEDYKYIYDDNRQLIRCFNQIDGFTKYIIISPCILDKKIKSSHQIQKKRKINSLDIQFSNSKKFLNIENSFSSRKNDYSDSISTVSTATMLLKSNKLKNYQSLKLKLGEIAALIDAKLPKLNEIGIKSLTEKYKLKEGMLHTLYAKYKMLVLLSFSINPNHNIYKGIDKTLFIDSFVKANKNSKVLLEKICENIDIDNNNFIDLHEYLKAMNIIIYGNYNEQIDMFFSVYDTNKNGTLSFMEIQELCKVQLYFTNSDGIMDYLSESFASLIFDMAGLKYTQEINAEELKKIIENSEEKFIREMFCSFNCLKN